MRERRIPWRESERPPLWRGRREHGLVVILACGAWAVAAENLWAAATGGSSAARLSGWGALAYGLGGLAMAVPLTWLVWAYVRRPVEGGDQGTDPDAVRAGRARDDAERTAWRSR